MAKGKLKALNEDGVEIDEENPMEDYSIAKPGYQGESTVR